MRRCSMRDTDNLIAYLDAVRELEVVQAYKQRSLTLLQIKKGDFILDLGCGPGTDTLLLADMAGNTGRVVGLDKRPEMIAEARLRARAADGRLEYLVGDAYHL